jgi:hypothetical protein
VLLSKPTGAGAPERNWADVKVVFDKKKASRSPGKVEKKVKIYGTSRRDPTLSGKCSSSPKDDALTEDDEPWDGLGLDNWDFADTTALAMYATGRQFYNFTEEAHEGLISNQEVEHGGTLVARYKDIRFFDEDIGEGTYHRIRADRFSLVGKRGGGWLATCDEMPSDGPSEGPAEDKERTDEHDPEVYIINGVLHTMIAAAAQAPGVIGHHGGV